MIGLETRIKHPFGGAGFLTHPQYGYLYWSTSGSCIFFNSGTWWRTTHES